MRRNRGLNTALYAAAIVVRDQDDGFGSIDVRPSVTA
jgi:hypothetical protein